MTVTVIDRKNGFAFRNLISERVFGQIGSPDILAVGAVDDGGLASGALVVRLADEETTELIWLFVAENRRGQGAASAMLYALHTAMAENGGGEMYCLLPKEDAAEDLKKFMGRRGFSFSPVTEELAIMPLAVFQQRLKSFAKLPGETMPVGEIPRRFINRYFAQKSARGKSGLPPLGDVDLSAIHPCSRGMLKNGELIGLVLFLPREEGDGVALVLAQAKDPALMARLLYDSLLAAERMCPPDPLLTVATLDGFGSRMRKILGDFVRTETFVCASYTV